MWHYRIANVWLVPLFILLAGLGPQAAPLAWDLRETGREGNFVFYDAPAGASARGKPLDAGDLNGDGCGDLAISGVSADASVSGRFRNDAGHVRVVMDLCAIDGWIDMSDQAVKNPTVRTFWGARSGDMAGTEVYVGDVNADGYDDVAFGSQNYDGPNQDRVEAGAVYLILGSAEFAVMGDVDLLQPPDNAILFYGATARDRFGIWVDGGDFNDDGFIDLLIGATQADGEDEARVNAGETWIIYGTSDPVADYGKQVDMREPPETATRVIGVDYDDLLGSTTLGGDVNADDFDDAIVSASLWRESAGVGGVEFGGGDGSDNRRYNSGEVFVVFGHEALPGTVIDLAALLDDQGQPINESIAVIYGPDPGDVLGEELAVGDINGDGRNELALGTLVSAGLDNSMPEAGEAWILNTSEPFAGQAFDLAETEPGRATVIYTDQAGSMGGDILRFADLDSDGYDELLYGAPTYDVTGSDLILREDAGLLAILFGSQSGLPGNEGQILLPSSLPSNLRARYILGADSGDEMAYGLAVYDIDGDGYLDIAPNGMLGDGSDNTLIDAGEVYVISGRVFLKP